MADIDSLIAKVRVELGDLGKSFVTQFVSDGTTNRFRLHYEPVDAASVAVIANGINVTDSSSVEQSTGTLVVTLTAPEYAITNVVGNGTTVTYTSNNALLVGQKVTVTGVAPTAYNGVDMTVTSANSTSFTVAKTTNLSYTSGGHAYMTSLIAYGSAVPKAGVEFTVSGTYYRYFTSSELGVLVQNAVDQHGAKHTDSVGRAITVASLPPIEEYPVAVYATTLALYTLATDASFDIDIMAPDGVSIPRSERYRQLMEMVNARQAQYRDLCVQLGIGLYSIDVFSLRRTSKATGRLVPVYKPMEVDDRSFPQRAHVPVPTYGDVRPAFPTEAGDLTAYQGRAFIETVPFSGVFTGKSFIAKLMQQRGGVQVVGDFVLSVLDNEDGTFLATISLTADETMRLANRTWWELRSVDDETAEEIVISEGNLFTIHASEVII